MRFDKKKRPIIGITRPEVRKANVPFWALWLAIWLGGGRPRILSTDKPDASGQIHGLMLGGGTDVFPGLFATQPKDDYRYDRPRDEMEIKWLKRAEKELIPVFAICRGAQLMNVVNQGTLHMDIEKAYPGVSYPDSLLGHVFFRKKISIEPSSLLYEIFQKKELMVNSLHKQSINHLGKGLVVTARETNGVIQAIERPGHPFYLGVQFHPELMIYRSSFRSFFRKFIGVARSKKASG